MLHTHTHFLLRTVLGSAALCCASAAYAIVDLNSNGVSDIWEQKYNATALVVDIAAKNSDEDGDGQTNLAESMAGTDPRDPASVHRIDAFSRVGDVVTLVCPTEKGKTYQPTIRGDLQTGLWNPYGSPALAAGNTMNAVISGQSADRAFYRVIVADTDSDNDGIPDWAEEQLFGFDSINGDSFGSGTSNNDLIVLQSHINALTNSEITITATTPDAFEKEATPAVFTIARSGDLTYPLTLFLATSGHPNISKGSASPSDYILKDSGGAVIEKSVTIPAGASSVEIFCHPVTDALTEVPETLTCTIGGSSISASVRICDATNIPANARLFVAQLSPEPGVVSTGSGLSTILLQGDNSVGTVNLNFYGLTTPQTAVHIHIKNPINGPHVESLPMGQIDAHPWHIIAAHFLATDQAVLDSLLAGQLYINVHSSDYPAGEIRGDFLTSTGSTDLVIPIDPPTIVALTGDELDRDIARFLTQSTFGATPELITELRNLVNSSPHNGNRISAYGAWLDAQMAMTSTNLEPHLHAIDAQQIFLSSIPGSPDYRENYTPGNTARRNAWWTLAKAAPDQYRQRVAFALSEIFVTSSNDSTVRDRHYGHAHYYDMLKDGAFGSYRDLLEDVSTHPIMGQYLSHLRNSKAILDGGGNVIISPDENYAREVMQLFSIGLVQLHEDGSLKLNANGLPDPTYLQDDISAMSRVFTGWSFSKRHSPSSSNTVIDNTSFSYGSGSRYYQAQWSNRMKNFADYHDTDEKVIPTLGLTISAGGDGESDLDATMEHLSNHANTAPFITRRLIQRLVTSNPSAGYIYRVTQVWKSTNGDLGAVFKAILLDYEARSIDATAAISYGKKKEPILHTLAVLRGLGAESNLPLAHLDPADTSIADLSSHAYAPDKLALFTAELNKFPAGTMRMRMNDTDGNIGQTPLHAPTVFNWFLPDYSVVGPLADAGLRVPEFQIATEISVITNANVFYQLAYYGSGLGGSSLRNQKAHDENGAPHPIYNPYGYGDNDDHQILDLTSASAMGQAYMAIMDTNADGKVSSADTTFDNRSSIVAACVALVDHVDLLLTSGRLKADFSSGYIPDIRRDDNPRDIIIDTLANYATYYDDNDNDEDQEYVFKGRLKLAVYLIANSPQALIQR
ncbi:hypothetical protein NT6N_01590 [Oceaniferula spumae]|uniref:CHRD domain-containing protein n=1 Tax=Oceaniferula spumae TaxID=2979115 RepID=A0AAT9FGN0_9BACT